MSASLRPTYIHPSPLQTLAPHLLPYLPHSLPLLRRLQFHHSPPTAHVFATFSPKGHPPHPGTGQEDQADPDHFAAAWVDRTRAPETECWLFSTYEVLPDRSPSQPTHAPAAAKAQLLAILAAIASLPSDSELIVLGTLSSPLLHLIGGDEVGTLKESPVLTRDIEEMRQSGSTGVFGGMSIPYLNWLIASPRPSGAEQGDQGLPEGYSFDIVRGEREEFRRVMSRTEIPRTEESLGRMGCVGVRYGEELAAWVFLGVDGSITALYVEPAHRGKGLAKAASRKLLRGLAEDPVSVGFRKLPEIAVEGAVGGSGGLGGQRGLEIGWEEGQERGKGEGWADGDVAVDNLESAGVARGLGGKKGWEVRWVSVDLRRVKEVVGL